MHKVLGGAMRCGKSTIIKHLCADEDLVRISTDQIRKSARSRFKKDVRYPLFAWGTVDALKGDAWVEKHTHSADELVDLFTDEARYLQPYITKTVNETPGELLIEGSHILPKFALTLTDMAHITYIVDTSPDQYIRIAKAQNVKDIHYVEAWSHFNIAFSIYLRKQCKLYGIRCFDIADLGFEQTIALVTTTLATK